MQLLLYRVLDFPGEPGIDAKKLLLMASGIRVISSAVETMFSALNYIYFTVYLTCV